MVTGRGDLESLSGERLSAHLGEVRFGSSGDDNVFRRHVRPGQAVTQYRHEIDQRGGCLDAALHDNARLGHVGNRNDRHEPGRLAADSGNHRRHPGYTSQRAVEPEFPDEAVRREPIRRDDLGGGEDADGEGQIQPNTALAEAGRREVDRDPPVGPRQSTREDGGTDAVPGLPARLVG